MRRSVPALIVIAALAGAALTGCASSGSDQSCSVKSGAASEAITATGKFGKDPKATVPSPLNAKKTQATTLIKGDGAKVEEGSAAELSVTLYNPANGEPGQTESGYFAVATDQIGKGLTHALECATAGSRLAVVISPNDGASDLGAAKGQSIAAVVDVEAAVPGRATGDARPATPGFPTVVLDTDGRPGIVIPADQAEPKKLQTAVLKKGDGAKTKKSDTLLVQTQTVTWSDKTSATGTWESGSPAAQQLNDGTALSKALIGQTIGSQVEVLIPASKSDDGEAEVTVVDLLGVLPAS
ncbi:FKBP-type peptidyl-prolyl cis-trans isomerase [Gryllotalpicola ginsengisoli]|uniref:FKBP-type peptidyl-prolyl cis-trans isomerase n=1 Tax=Gryllotalpicola ginsengisoli TaxID=444608 RepID=UPI0003B6785D|nr:hypothetical protein [Gryllotalpicola ginsengisoli]